MSIKFIRFIFVKNNKKHIMKNLLTRLAIVSLALMSVVSVMAHFKTTPNSPVHITESGKFVYKAYPNGDRIPDFSFFGY